MWNKRGAQAGVSGERGQNGGGLHRGKLLLLTTAIFSTIALLTLGQLLPSFSVYYGIPALHQKGVTYRYSLWEGIQKLYEDKVYIVATMLLLWSGIWPHVKLLLLCLFSWMTTKDVRPRLRAFEWLAAMGKWSFLDVWVVSLIIIAIRLDQDYSLLGFNAIVWFQAVGESGVFVFFGSIVISQIISDVLITGHRAIVVENPLDSDSGLMTESDTQYGTKWSLRQVVTSPTRKIATTLALTSLGVIVAVGTFIPTFRLTYNAAKKELEVDDYSVFTGFLKVAEVNHTGDGNIVLAVIGLLGVVLLPMIQIVMLFMVWFKPATQEQHFRMHRTMELVGHWSCLDTFYVALVIVLLEIGHLVEASSLGKLVKLKMLPLPALYIVGISTILLNFVKWSIESQHGKAMRPTGTRRPLLFTSEMSV